MKFNIGDSVTYIGNLHTFVGIGRVRKISTGTAANIGVLAKDEEDKETNIYWCYPASLKLVEPQINIDDKERATKMFKPLLRKPDGTLESIWAGKGERKIGTTLTYKEGEITYASEGTLGIWVSESIEQAQTAGVGSKRGEGDIVVHEVVALGHQLPSGGTISGSPQNIRYPAIILGAEVRREPPPMPAPKFKVGDKVTIPRGNIYGDKKEKVYIIADALYGSAVGHKHWHYYVDSYLSPTDEDWLELVPKEEWEDITRECTFKPSSFAFDSLPEPEKNQILIAINHGKKFITFLGLNQLELPIPLDYKIEPTYASAQGTQWFRILHRVSK